MTVSTSYIVAQIFFILDAVFDVIGLRQREKKNILIFFAISTTASALGFALLRAYPGALSMLTMTTCGIVNYSLDKRASKKSDDDADNYARIMLLVVSVFIVVIIGIMTFERIVDVFPVVGACCHILAMGQSRERSVRICEIMRLILFIAYDCTVMAYFALLTDVGSALLLATIILRHDIMPRLKPSR